MARHVCTGLSALCVTTLTGAVIAVFGCSSASSADSSGEVREAYEEPWVCDVDWTKWVSPRAPTGEGPSSYTRPFFTVCEEGVIRWNVFTSYKNDPAESLNFLETANTIIDPDGKCQWGICAQDARYLSDFASGMGDPIPATLRIRNSNCNTCNINNVMWHWAVDEYDSGLECDYGTGCCPTGGGVPCPNKVWEWGILLEMGELGQFKMDLRETDFSNGHDNCLDTGELYCGPEHNAHCVPGTTSLITTEWRINDFPRSRSFVGILELSGAKVKAVLARITMGGSYDTMANDVPGITSGCKDPETGHPGYPGGYFTCSGAAVIQTEADKWYRIVWLHKYNPNHCDRPCWMATEEDGIPVEAYVQALPGDPDQAKTGSR